MSQFRTVEEGEELVRKILDAVPGGVIHLALDYSVRTANADALRFLGLRYDEVAKVFVTDAPIEVLREDGTRCSPEDYPAKKVLTTGVSQPPVTLGIRRSDRPAGDLRWAIFRAEPVLDVGSRLSGAIVTFLDITERKAGEEALRRSEEKWRVLAANLPDFVVIVDRDGRFLSVNRLLPELEEAAVLASTLFDYCDDASRDSYRGAFDRARDTNTTVRAETRALGPRGDMVWYETIMVPLSEGGGLPQRLLCVSRDVTERRTMLAGLAEKERLASIGMVAASVAHEIMNPLSDVLANLDLVLDPSSDDECRRSSALEARDGARRMQQIVWDLRSLGRGGGEDLLYVDARVVLESALRLAGPEVAATANIVLELGEVPSVVASQSKLCQVFINLLVNAAQAIHARAPQQREIRVKTRYDEPSELVGIDIIDNGEGIPPEQLARIFEPFFTTKKLGTGLGLSICRDIIERMRGRIDVTSTPDVGTTFTVWLPTTRAARIARPATPSSRSLV